ncbi:MAG: hypothetical protein MK132_20395 [Lentisphaerales bacterium]|nr:hypothetical protein [Lentisphaerales bacterium]
MLLPSLSDSRLKSKATVCKSNLKQIYVGQMVYSNDNDGRVFATEYGAEWMMAKDWRNLDTGGCSDFYDGQTGFLEPYFEQESTVYRCPASSYD